MHVPEETESDEEVFDEATGVGFGVFGDGGEGVFAVFARDAPFFPVVFDRFAGQGVVEIARGNLRKVAVEALVADAGVEGAGEGVQTFRVRQSSLPRTLSPVTWGQIGPNLSAARMPSQ